MLDKSIIDLYDNLGIKLFKTEFYEGRRIDINQKRDNTLSFKYLSIDVKNKYIFNLSKNINNLKNEEEFEFDISKERGYLYDKIKIRAKKINEEQFYITELVN